MTTRSTYRWQSLFKEAKIAQLFAILAAVLYLTAADTSKSIVVIVNAANPVTSVSANDLKDYFFKRKREWPDGSRVRFIDHVDSNERAFFLNKILKKSSEDLDSYWIGQKLYSGDSAPVQSSSDSMSIQFVSTFKGAIGYISPDTPVKDKNVKVIQLTGVK